MKCDFCGHEVAPGITECPYCHYQFKIDTQVLSPDERDDFDGLTIEEDGATSTSSGREEPTGRDLYEEERAYDDYRAQQRPEVKVRTFGCGPGILTTLLFLAIICSMFVFALPIVLVFAAIGAIVVYILRLLF